MTRTILTFFICLGLFSCSVKQSETESSTADSVEITTLTTDRHSDKNFDLIDDFEKSKSTFRPDTFELFNHSTDGGQLIAYHTKDKDYLVLEIWLFGETGKIHSTYWTDRKLNFKIIKRTDFVYDKPYYEKDYKVTETTEFYSYSDSSFKRYNSDKQEIKNSDNSESEVKVKKFFADITKDIEIVK
ncbi:MAG TPA: hypothetical protein DCE81_09870 [Cytophagales bacterium]|nr:hypothetical protein [Cytophagales bacterium]